MKTILALGIGSFLLWSCANNPEKSTAVQETATAATHAHHAHADGVELNDGARWVVNEEMKPFVSKGSELVDVYIQTKQTDYKALAGQLKAQNDQLIKSCTMQGKSHDELHRWLHPHLELVAAVAQAADDLEAATSIQALAKSYQAYQQYFQ